MPRISRSLALHGIRLQHVQFRDTKDEILKSSCHRVVGKRRCSSCSRVLELRQRFSPTDHNLLVMECQRNSVPRPLVRTYKNWKFPKIRGTRFSRALITRTPKGCGIQKVDPP